MLKINEVLPDQNLTLQTLFLTPLNVCDPYFVFLGMSDGVKRGSACEIVGQTRQGFDAAARGEGLLGRKLNWGRESMAAGRVGLGLARILDYNFITPK